MNGCAQGRWSSTSYRAIRLLLAAACIAGLITRAALLDRKPFWRDEAWVADLVANAPVVGAVDPARPRPVPIGFLALAKAGANLAGGAPEVRYRLVPLLCGVAALPALAALNAALGGAPSAGVIAVWLAAGLPALVYYARELKSYGLDLLFAVLIPLLAVRACGRAAGGAAPARWHWAALLAGLAVAPWTSFGSAFPIAAVLVWGWLAWWRRAGAATRAGWLAATLVYAFSFGAAYVLTLRTQAGSERLLEFWQARLYAAHGVDLLAQIPDAVRRFGQLAATYLFHPVWPAALPLALVGAATWPRSHRALVWWLCVAPPAAAIAASLADRYLLVGRLLLFAAPPLLLCTAAGLIRVGHWMSPRYGVAAATGLAVAVSLALAAESVVHRVGPYRSDPSRYFLYDVLHDADAAIDRAAALAAPGEAVLISVRMSKQFLYYARGRLADATVCRAPCPEFPAVLQRWLDDLPRRGWLLLLEEEQDDLAPRLDPARFAHHERAAVRGAVVWEVVRRADPP